MLHVRGVRQGRAPDGRRAAGLARPLVHDGQNTQKAGKLRKNWRAVETHATAYADLILAVRSACFIGNPASSFSANVVMIRRARGADELEPPSAGFSPSGVI